MLLFALASSPAHAFAEDLCYRNGRGLASCNDLACDPGEDDFRCTADAVTDIARLAGGGRSMVHVDATFYLAQAVGLDASTAYWVAAYSEATDLTQYYPADRDGQLLATPDQCDPDGDGVIDGDAPAACELVTVRLSGLARTNTGTGGSLLHFVVPHDHTGQGPIPGIDGRAPDVTDADREKMLAQLRDWAFGEVSTICTGGFRTDGRCPTSGASIRGDVPVLAVAGAIPLDTLQGEQIVDEAGRGALDDVLGNLDALFARTDSPVERRAAPLGVYLHALQDRVSHFRCGDASFSTGEAGQDVEVVFDQVECAQPVHALRHAWEVGVDPATVPEDERTTPAALAITYDELRAWATARGIAAADAAKPAVRARHLATMGRVLSIPDGEARVRAMEQAIAQAGFEQMPGHGT